MIRIAYLILAHRYPEHLVRLIDRLNYPNTIFLIHVDKKTNENYLHYIKTQLTKYDNIFFINRYNCYWGGFGIIKATIQGMLDVIEKGFCFDYLILLSGQDYPIKTNAYIQNFLKINNGKSFVNHYVFPFDEWKDENGGWDRIQKWHFIRNKIYTIPQKKQENIKNVIEAFFYKAINKLFYKRELPNHLTPFGGAQFWGLHYNHLFKIYNYLKANNNVVEFFKYVFVPDEILIQTLVGNLINNDEIINDTLTYLEWYRQGAILLSEDFEKISSTYHLFARKFDNNVDKLVLDLIDTEILNVHNLPIKNNLM